MSAILRALRTLPIYVVTGKTKYNSFDADAAVPAQDTGTLNDSLNAGGALGVTQITDITGLVAWKDYIPVQNETGRTVPYSFDANGYIPIKKIGGGTIFESATPTSILNFNGTNLSTTITDSGTAPLGTWAVGNTSAYLQTSNKKFGTAALLAGRVGVYSDNCPMPGGTGDFTIDFWINGVSEVNVPWLFHAKPAGATGLGLGINYNAGVLVVNFSTNGSTWHTGGSVITTTTRVLNANSVPFQHVALTLASGNLRLFVDGVQKGSTYAMSGASIVACTRFLVGNLWDPASNVYGVAGNIDAFRFIKNQALWTANFTPPTSEPTI